MARRNHDDDLLLEEDELTAAFLGDEGSMGEASPNNNQQPTGNPTDDQWDEDEAVLKDGVLTISFGKVKQDTVKKIQVL